MTNTQSTKMHGLSLVPHPYAREKCINSLGEVRKSGDVLISIPSWTAIVSPEQKARRCDGCFLASTELHRCSGCASYWYCGSSCTLATVYHIYEHDRNAK